MTNSCKLPFLASALLNHFWYVILCVDKMTNNALARNSPQCELVTPRMGYLQKWQPGERTYVKCGFNYTYAVCPRIWFHCFLLIFFINKYRPTCHWKSFEIYVWHKIILRWSFFFTGSIFTPTQTNENKNMEHLQGLKRENLTSYHNIHFSCTSQFFSIINWVLLQWKCWFFLETWSDNRTENRDCFHFKE